MSKKNRLRTTIKTSSVISRQEAEELNLEILTVREYAVRFFISESSVRYYINKGRIRTFKTGGTRYVVIREGWRHNV